MSTATPPALVQVLGNAGLFRRITAFQVGLDMALLDFWRSHRGQKAPLRFDFETGRALVQLLVKHGSLRLLRMAERVRFSASPPPMFTSTLIFKLPIREHVADWAFNQHRVDVLEWALVAKSSTFEEPSYAWSDAITRAGEDGDMRMLEILRKHAPLVSKKQVFDIAKRFPVNMKHVSVLRFIVDALPEMQATLPMVALAVAHRDRPLLEQLHPRGVIAPPRLGAYEGFAFGSRDLVRIDALLNARDFDLLAFLLEFFHEQLDPFSIADLLSHTDPEFHRLALRFAGNLQCACVEQINAHRVSTETVQQWIAMGILSPKWPISIDTIASKPMLDVIQLLHKHGIATATTDAMDLAAEKKRWEVVEFLHFNRSEGCTTRAMDAAIEQANLKYVLFLRDHRTEGCSPRAAEKAAQNKQSTAMLQFLHEQMDTSFTPAVMDAAAACGNLAAVRFLHENRTEGCTTAAMDDAVSNGHSRVAQYLHTHRSEGCTFNALYGAMVWDRLNTLDMVGFLFHNYRHLFHHVEFNQELVARAVVNRLQWHHPRDGLELLCEHFPYLFSQDLLRRLLNKGMIDMCQALLRQFPDGILSQQDIVMALSTADRDFGLDTIRFIVDVLGRRDLAHCAMDGAASEEHCGTHWLRAVYAITGPQSCRLSAVQAAMRLAVGNNCKLDRVKFLIRHCCEPNALEAAINSIPSYANGAIATELRNWDPTTGTDDELPLHPFLLDPRVRSWAIKELFHCGHVISPSGRTWAEKAAHNHDMAMLEVIRDMPEVVDHTHASHGYMLDAEQAAQLLRFDNAPTHAIEAGNMKALQWLLSHVEGPVDPTLLGKAVYYDQREIAEWLVAHHPEACVKVQWSFSGSANHINVDMAHWLEHTPAVRNALDFDGVVRYFLVNNDVESLRRLYALDADRVLSLTTHPLGERTTANFFGIKSANAFKRRRLGED